MNTGAFPDGEHLLADKALDKHNGVVKRTHTFLDHSSSMCSEGGAYE
jgi:hypothetical protein